MTTSQNEHHVKSTVLREALRTLGMMTKERGWHLNTEAAAALLAERGEFKEKLRLIGIRAEAGLCQMTHGGAREFLRDICKMVGDSE